MACIPERGLARDLGSRDRSGSLTVVLEEGQRERWFESQMIVTLSLVSLAGMILIALSQIFAKRPIMRLSLMRNPRYASVIVIVSAVGAGLYGVSYLLPQFLRSSPATTRNRRARSCCCRGSPPSS